MLVSPTELLIVYAILKDKTITHLHRAFDAKALSILIPYSERFISIVVVFGLSARSKQYIIAVVVSALSYSRDLLCFNCYMHHRYMRQHCIMVPLSNVMPLYMVPLCAVPPYMVPLYGVPSYMVPLYAVCCMLYRYVWCLNMWYH